MGDPRLTGAIRKKIEKKQKRVRVLREVLADHIDKGRLDDAAKTQRKIVRKLLRIDGKQRALRAADQAEGLGDGGIAIVKEIDAEQEFVDELVKEIDLLIRAGDVPGALGRRAALEIELERIAGKRTAKDIAERLLEPQGKKKKKKQQKKK